MSDANYALTPQVLPSGFCPPSWQAILNEFAANLFVTIPISNNKLVVSATKPADTTVAWFQLDSLGRPTYLFYFAQGAWLARHPTAPGLTMWWFKAMDQTTLNTFDGGDANAASAISGPMWEFAKTPDGTVIAAKFPIAAGTLPSGKVLAVGDTGGLEDVTLSSAQSAVAPHKHLSHINAGVATGVYNDANGHEATAASQVCAAAANTGSAVEPYTADAVALTDTTVVQSHTNMGPFCCGILLARSQRLFYRVD